MSNWWADRLAGQQAEGKPEIRWGGPTVVLPRQPPPHEHPRPTESSRREDSCPSCDSANYMSPPGGKTNKRCFDCGHPQVQSGSGVGTTGASDGVVREAKQVPTDGYHPGVIVGRVD